MNNKNAFNEMIKDYTGCLRQRLNQLTFNSYQQHYSDYSTSKNIHVFTLKQWCKEKALETALKNCTTESCIDCMTSIIEPELKQQFTSSFIDITSTEINVVLDVEQITQTEYDLALFLLAQINDLNTTQFVDLSNANRNQ